MKKTIFLLILISGLIVSSCGPFGNKTIEPNLKDEPKSVTKTNPVKVYMHYMPWFHSKDVSGYWGIHWRMSNKDPDKILANGNREIAAHYYPLIGPYDSGDPDLVDYHLLLMKYAGIDGVLIDWYGSHDVLDYGSNLKNSNAFLEGIKRTGLGFGIVYEEFTAEEVARRKSFTAIEAAQKDMKYLEENYFSSDQYIKIGEKPLLMTFGPRYFTSKTQWSQILGSLNKPSSFLPLWNHRHRVGDTNSSGEFAWVDFTADLTDLNNFYKSTKNELIMGSAYPGFHDFYAAGGWGNGYGFVDHKGGQTLENTLQKAKDYDLPYIQFVTWNDFGEGTMFEPTQEFQYKFCEMLQDFTGVSYDKSELEIIYTYYLKRKEYKGNAEAQVTLDKVFKALIQLDTDTAKSLIETL